MRTEWFINNVGTGVNTDTFTVPNTVVQGDVIERKISNQLVVPVLPIPVTITGTTFPAEVLTSSAAQQWYCDDVPISGETGLTYTIKLSDIGKVIGQRVIAADKTIWHPNDLPGIVGVYLANIGLKDDVGVACIDGGQVHTWEDQSGNGHHLVQATAGFRPLAQLSEISGNSTVQFDGTDDFYNIPGSLGAFQDKAHGYIVAALSDLVRTGGSSTHYAVQFTTPAGGTNSRLALATRGGGDNFRAQGKTLDADAGVSSASVASADGYFVLTAEADWAAGKLRLRRDGTQPGLDTTLTSSGNTSNTASATATIGKGSTLFAAYQMAAVIIAAPSAAWSATDRSRAERYAGLLIGKSIPLQ